jgi:Tfp pilus assembly protein PilF
MSLRPRTLAVLNNLGNALRNQKKPDEAIRHLRRAIELEPENAAANINLGGALLEQKK